MTWTTVAKKDFRDARRSRSLWVLSAVFVLFAVGLAYIYAEFPALFGAGQPGAPASSIDGLLFTTAGTMALFVSLTAIVVCYKAVAGERELGSIKILLALPHTRLDVMVGKVVGRGGVLAIPVLLAVVVGMGLGAVLLGDLAVVETLLLVVVSLVFVLSYASIVVGISGLTGSTQRASALAVGFFVVFELLWDVVPVLLVWVANGFSLPARTPDWVFVANQVPPSSAYTTALVAVLPDAPAAVAGNQAATVEAFYGTPWLGVAMLAFWLVGPFAVGYWRFEGADL